ncbi:iron-sulfur cluster assembly scaffold protein [Desulfomicrobium salsuginis]
MGDDFDRIVAVLQETINEDTREAWGEEAFQRWIDPPNRGALANADGAAELRGPCGDSMAIFLKFDGERVGAASFETDGCGPSVVCGSIAAEMAVGKTAEEILDITGEEVLARAGQIPEDHHHCAFLAVTSLHEAVNRHMRPDSKEG